MSSSSYDLLDGKKIKVKEILDLHTCKITESVHRRITFKETLKNLGAHKLQKIFILVSSMSGSKP